MECSTNISSPSYVLLTNRLEYKQERLQWKAAICRKESLLSWALLLFRCDHRLLEFSCLVFLSHSRPLARALEFSSSFSFWFPLLFPFRRSSPLFCFSSRDVSPSVVCLLRFPPFTSSWCGNELWFRHVSFVCGIQPVVHFWTFLRICFSSNLFETFSLKENELDVSVSRYCGPSYTKGQACFFYPKQKTPLTGVFV